MAKYKCLLCGRDKFTRKTAHHCAGGYRKHGIKWEEIMEEKAKLTKRQAEVVKDIQDGAVFICDSEIRGATVAFGAESEKEDYHIHSGVFFNLVDKKVIYQQAHRPFDYVLTKAWVTATTVARDPCRGGEVWDDTKRLLNKEEIVLGEDIGLTPHLRIP